MGLASLFEVGDLLYEGPWIAERTAVVGDFIADHPDEVEPVVREIVLGGSRWSAVDAFRARYRLDELAVEVARSFDGSSASSAAVARPSRASTSASRRSSNPSSPRRTSKAA